MEHHEHEDVEGEGGAEEDCSSRWWRVWWLGRDGEEDEAVDQEYAAGSVSTVDDGNEGEFVQEEHDRLAGVVEREDQSDAV